MYKCIAIHGIKLDGELLFPIMKPEAERERNIAFIPYEKFINSKEIKLVNPEAIVKCDMVAVYHTLTHNSLEIYYIKLFISIIFFSLRISCEQIRFKQCLRDEFQSYIQDKQDWSQLEGFGR